MHILSIETSCDETAVSVVRADSDFPNATYTILGDALFSQVDIHKEYGGVFPALAKREHAKTLVPMLGNALSDANMIVTQSSEISGDQKEALKSILEREPDMYDAFINFIENHEKPDIDYIAVTNGPGLEPALWVGVNFARALSYFWNIPVIPVNHMEGHIFSSIFDGNKLADISFPALSLLISGGHTEIILMKDWHVYEKIGQTVDDAVGEAFDKVARMLALPYPGGPQISKLAEEARQNKPEIEIELPRPMIHTDNYNMSFSGLKTAVLYKLKEFETLTDDIKKATALAFEDAITEVLIKKVSRAIEERTIKTLILGGGVSANKHIRNSFENLVKTEYTDTKLFLPEASLTTDNAVMIALSGHARTHEAIQPTDIEGNIRATGKLTFSIKK